MGRQQLLLLVLGVVIVGLTVVTGVETFSQGARKSAADDLMMRNVNIARKAAVWKTRNDPFNGGNAQYDGLEGRLDILSMQEETPYGRFAIVAAAGSTLEIVGVSTRYPELGVRTYVTNYDVIRSEVKYDGSITME